MSLLDNHHLKSIAELVRFYQAAIVNTAFGVGLYMLLVYAGLNIYVAQIISHFAGVAFNYFVYSRHVFRDRSPAKFRFALSYIVNYFVSLAVLAAFARVIASPYIAGIATTLVVSIGNYLVLKHLVFRRQTT